MHLALLHTLAFVSGVKNEPPHAWPAPVEEANEAEQAVYDALIASPIEPFICIAVCLVAYVVLSSVTSKTGETANISSACSSDAKSAQP